MKFLPEFMRVLVSSRLPIEGFSELEKHFEVVFPKSAIFSKEEIISQLASFDAFLPTFQFKVDKDIIDAGKDRLKIIANFGVGYNNIDVEYATIKGIVVTNTPDPVIEPTAEHAFALMLAAMRRIPECDRKLRTPNGLKWGVMENLGHTIYGKTLGIIGMGRIGQALARRSLASGMKIVYFNRTKLPIELESMYNAKRLELNELLNVSDIVSINVPFNKDSFHLINRDTLKLMKNTAVLINTARGQIVDELALVEALQRGWINSAALDVFENEPIINPDLLKLDNVTLAPHNGTATIETRIEMSRFASQNIIHFFEGNKNITRIN